MTVVVDASVVIKWFVPEAHTDEARRLLAPSARFAAPDLLFAEVANTVWKKVRRGELTVAQGQRLVADLERIDVETVPCRALAADAHALATATGCTVYDSMYLALAVRSEAPMVTADARLATATARFPGLAKHVRHLADSARN